MTTTAKLVLLGVLTFVLGASLPALLIWNPACWAWADRMVGRGRVSDAATPGEAGEKKQLWTCGMHPQVIQDEPGTCPICGMRLTPVKDAEAMEQDPSQQTASEGQGERNILYWRAPMDPNYISDKPGKSPMGMDLVPVYADETEQTGGPTVRVDPNFLQNFAVRTAVVERGSIPLDIRTVGILSHNEETVVSVNVKFEGWIEKAYYNNVGQYVTIGDVLFEIYSPQLVTTQQEYLAALDYVKRLSEGAYDEAVQRAQSLLEAARERLRYWDITEEQIRKLEQTRKANRTLQVISPASGFIVAKMSDSLEGMHLAAGMTVLKLADHSKLWAEVKLYEDDIQHIRQGTPVRVEVRSFPGRSWRGRVVFFDSALDPKTRTLRAYVEIDNKDLKLRPKMYADVMIRAPAVRGAVKVPQQAILHSGERAVVIVQKGRGVFEPREVELGPAGGDYQEVRRDLQAGEVIVTSSQFLIDSESNLKAAISQLLGERAQPKAMPGDDQKASPMSPQH